MSVLKNSRHEKFALASFKGMTGKDAAIEAGYIYKNDNTIKATASRLLTYVNITERIAELHEKAESPAIMDVQERQERLSEIGREDLEGKHGPLRQPNISAIRELNLMGGDYPPNKVELTGKDGEPILDGLLERLRGYSKKDEG